MSDTERVGEGVGAVAHGGRINRAAQNVLGAAFTLASLAWCGDFYRRVLGLLLFPEQLVAALLGIGLAIAFLRFPFRRGGERSGAVPWYDVLLAGAGFVIGCYVAVVYPNLQARLVDNPIDALVCAFALIPLCLEAMRRTTGWAMVIIVLVAIAYGLFGYLLPGTFETRRVPIDRFFVYLSLDSSALLGLSPQVAVTVVPTFVLFGALLMHSGGADFFNDISIALFGRTRGAPAKITVVSSGLFGTVSGVAVANVLSSGVVTIPMMKRAGYSPPLAAAVEAVSSTGGQLMPPVMGAAAFVMADFLQVPYRDIAIAATIPSILFYLALYIESDLDAAKHRFKMIPAAEIPKAWGVMRDGWIFVVPFAAMIYTMFWLNWEPELGAIAACASVLAVGFLKGYRGRRMRPYDVVRAIIETGIGSIVILMVVAGAAFVEGFFGISGFGFAFTALLVDIGKGSVFLLLGLSAVMCVILGMGLPTISVYVLLAALMGPAMAEVGILPIAAHLFLLYFGMMSLVTPPSAVAAFVAAGLAGATPMRTAFMCMRYGWTAYIVPFLFVFSPALLMRGSVTGIVVAVIAATAGVWFVCVGIVGYFIERIAPATRLAFFAAGLGLLVPHDVAAWAVWTNLAGAVLGAPLALWHWRGGRRRMAPAT